MKTNHQVQAEKKVNKAVGVFAKAIAEVETAQDLLTKGVEQDTLQILAIVNQKSELDTKIIELNVARDQKGHVMVANAELLNKLKEFKV